MIAAFGTLLNSAPLLFWCGFRPERVGMGTGSGGPEWFAAEVAKARLLEDASSGAPFSAPAVVDVDEAAHSISYQRLDCDHDLLAVLVDPDRSVDAILGLLYRVGSCLAAIHDSAPPAELTVVCHRSNLFTEAVEWRTATGCGIDRVDRATHPHRVLQHGDFGFTNIFIGSDDQITVIDPSPNGYTSIHPLNLDCPELDLAVICGHTVGRVASLQALGRTARHGWSMATAILDGYESVGPAIDRPRLRLFTLAGIDAVIAQRSPGSRAHRRALLGPISALLARNLP